MGGNRTAGNTPANGAIISGLNTSLGGADRTIAAAAADSAAT